MTLRGRRLFGSQVGRAKPAVWRARASALLALGVLVALGLVTQPAAAATASITLQPTSGPPTTTVNVTGTGFGATETVDVYFDAMHEATATTLSTGTFSTTFTVPTSAQPGKHTVKATGQTSLFSATARFLVRTDWDKFHFDVNNSGYNHYENTLGPANVSGLKPAWTEASSSSTGSVGSSPAVAGGVVYVLSTNNGKLYAYSADGTTGCSGIPPTKTCAPLWTGTGGAGSSANVSSPTVAGGVVYVGSGYNLYAFAAGPSPSNCSGTPKTCPPLWTAATRYYIVSAPVVAGGVVYVTSESSDVYAFTAGPNPSSSTCPLTGTPPIKTCPPLWEGAVTGANNSTPAVAGGVVYVGSGYNLYAFRAGTSPFNCSTTSDSGSGSAVTYTGYRLTDTSKSWLGNQWNNATVSVNGGAEMGIASVNDAHTITLATYWSGGTPTAGSAYSLTIKTCPPLWTAAFSGGQVSSSAPAVAGGVVYIGAGGFFQAFNAGTSPSNCSVTGTPPKKTCPALWTVYPTAGAGGLQASPAVANGVVYEGSSDGKLYAFKAGSNPTNCFVTGTPPKTTCPPLWTAAGGGGIYTSSPAVANGVVYSGNGGQYLYAFSASGTTGCSTTSDSGSGSAVTYGSNSLTDTSKTWSGQWTNATISVNGGTEMGIASGNSAHTITLATTSWGGGTPAPGSPYSVTIKTCAALGTMTTGSNATYSSPAVANGMVYIGTWYGTFLHAFSL